MNLPPNSPEDRAGLAGVPRSTEGQGPLDTPVIGIVVSDTDEGLHHASAVRRAGGEPLVMTDENATLDRIDGLVATAAPRTGSHGRSETQVAVDCVSQALDVDLPVLATGGGFLTLNVAAGGSLAEVNGHAAVNGDKEEPAYHRIYIAPGGKLAAVVGSGGFVRVNSRHTLGVREAQKAPGLLATAYSLEDGVIEALESPEHRWVIGVQFDPERRGELPPHFDRLFSSLVAHARPSEA